ncbi:phage major capsid protein [Pollutibacter soli]|uniref:phage major capsid protein n=1 Tax=Pollutibacter soli TaxID=3034157 RepID=UPI003013D8BB
MIDEINDKIDNRLKPLEDRVHELQAKGGRILGGNGEGYTLQAKVTEALIKNASQIKALLKGQEHVMQLKVAGNMTIGSNLTGDSIRSYAGTPQRPTNKFHLRNLITTVQTATGNIAYPRTPTTISEGSFSRVAENTEKSQMDYDVLMINQTLQYLAAWVKVSRVMLEDLPFLAAYISQSLIEDYLTAEDQSFFTSLTSVADTGSTSATETIDKILDYVAQVEASGYTASAVILRPSAWVKILKTAPSNYSTPAGVKVSDSGQVMVAGLPVFKSNLVASGKVWVGDFGKAAIAQAEAFNIRTAETGDDFIKNNVTVRAESRADIMIYSPKAFVRGDE